MRAVQLCSALGLAAGVRATWGAAVALRGRRSTVRRLGVPSTDRRRRTRLAPPAPLVRRLDDAAFPLSAPAAWTAWCTSVVVGVVAAGAAGGPGLALVTAAAWIGVPALGLELRRGAASRQVEASLPDVVEGMARSLRGGAGTHQALASAAAATPGRLGTDLRRTVADLEGGAGLGRALGALVDRRPEPGVRLAAAAILLGAEAGGSHARALDGVAAGARARLAVAAEVRALGSQARLSALVIGLAPMAFAVLALGADRSGADFLLRTPLGLGCLALGLLLDGVGAWWMHRLAQVGS